MVVEFDDEDVYSTGLDDIGDRRSWLKKKALATRMMLMLMETLMVFTIMS